MVSRNIRVVEAAGSNPVTPINEEARFSVISAENLVLFLRGSRVSKHWRVYFIDYLFDCFFFAIVISELTFGDNLGFVINGTHINLKFNFILTMLTVSTLDRIENIVSELPLRLFGKIIQQLIKRWGKIHSNFKAKKGVSHKGSVSKCDTR